jgi:hypothetical protein
MPNFPGTVYEEGVRWNRHPGLRVSVPCIDFCEGLSMDECIQDVSALCHLESIAGIDAHLLRAGLRDMARSVLSGYVPNVLAVN